MEMLSPAALRRRRVLVLSPHLDDAVFSCGGLLASLRDTWVVTVFAARPDAGMPLTEWDRAAGYGPDEDVIGLRRNEDRAALTMLGARPVWMKFLDSQYGASPRAARISAALKALMRTRMPETVFFPLGLFHGDHRLVHQAAIRLPTQYPRVTWFVYEDALYRRIPCLRDEKVTALRRAGWQPRRLRFISPRSSLLRKRRAVARYRSQLRALHTPGRPGHEDIFSPETYWHISPRVAP